MSATDADSGGTTATDLAFTCDAVLAAALPAERQSSRAAAPSPTTTTRGAASPEAARKSVAEPALPSISLSFTARATRPPRAESTAATGPVSGLGGSATQTTRRSPLAATGSADFLSVLCIALPLRIGGSRRIRAGRVRAAPAVWDTRHPVPAGGSAAMSDRPIRIVIAKPGLDGHDRGAKIIARSLRDAGMEVIYTGLHQTPEQIVATTIQEDADAVGLSILSGAHMTLVPRVLDQLRAEGADDVLVMVGGTIPREDIGELKRLGVAEVFTPGAPVQGMIEFIRSHVGAAS